MIMKLMKFILILIPVMILCACGTEKSSENGHSGTEIPLTYAEQFSIYENSDGTYEINIADGQKFIFVPDGTEKPENTDIPVIFQPENIYVSASSAMDLFDGIDALGNVKMTSTKINDWKLPAVEKALESGDIQYIGKYNAPDFEAIISGDCDLAVESTMIYHSPETKEQLENLGIPVIVERSSYESHPLGRFEWIKLYGLITGNFEKSVEFFDDKTKIFEEVVSDEISGQKPVVAFFYITGNGAVNVRKTGDYISKMIELAGGTYIFTAEDLGTDENALSTMNMDMETFYEKAHDADIIIYNSTIDGELESIQQLTEKNGLLKDFRAVQTGNVWCTGRNMFQQTTGMCDMIRDFHLIIAGNNENPTFLKKLE
ncbi:MAG: ABC transporter substrate-binding protein [Ruminococcus sp.]|nr:ABC transporter substrate-binding protein [Ruminococcus sp.]